MGGKQLTTVRELWIKRGGFGPIPPKAMPVNELLDTDIKGKSILF